MDHKSILSIYEIASHLADKLLPFTAASQSKGSGNLSAAYRKEGFPGIIRTVLSFRNQSVGNLHGGAYYEEEKSAESTNPPK